MYKWTIHSESLPKFDMHAPCTHLSGCVSSCQINTFKTHTITLFNILYVVCCMFPYEAVGGLNKASRQSLLTIKYIYVTPWKASAFVFDRIQTTCRKTTEVSNWISRYNFVPFELIIKMTRPYSTKRSNLVLPKIMLNMAEKNMAN